MSTLFDTQLSAVSPRVYQFRIGERVRAVASAFVTTRRSRIKEYHVNSMGLPCYWLEDGGLLFDSELESDELSCDRKA